MGHNKKTEIFIKVFYVAILLFLILQSYLFFIFIALHEIGHLICGILLGYKVKKFTLLPFGFSLCFKEVFIKPRDSVIISFFGPLTNLIFFVCFYFIYIVFPIEEIKVLIDINLMLLVFNLIPVGFLDGGRVLKEFISMYISFYVANIVINLNGIIFGCIMLGVSSYIVSPSSKIVFILIALTLILNSILQIKWIKMSIIKEALYKRFRKSPIYKLRKTKYYSEDTKVFDIMKNFSFNISYTVKCKKDESIMFMDKEIVNFYFTKGNITLKKCFEESRRNIDDKYKR